jgi:hypothetical protein
VRNGPGDFTVDPARDGKYVMVEIVNPGPASELVTLRGFVDGFGAVGEVVDGRVVRSQSNNLYLYVRPPDGPWQRVYACDRAAAFPFGPWIIEAPPGRTRVATVVTFTYQEYLDFVNGLPNDDPRVTREIVATSGKGRYATYRIRITNPRSPNKHKLRIAMCKTSHAYEKAGYFMAQGAIAWLLSGDPATNLDHIEWSIYPCLDPQAAHDGCSYIEQADLVMDDGRPRGDAREHTGALWDLHTGEIPSQHYHVLTDVHMWELRDCESYKYNDPFAPSGRAGNGTSQIEADLLGFWPFWYEFGIDNFDHENKWPPTLPVEFDRTQLDRPGSRPPGFNARPEDFGGALVTHLELPFYGKDDIDPADRLREQGRMWARSHSQAYLRMQRDRAFWTTGSPGGPVNVAGAVFLPMPEIILLEDLTPSSGSATARLNSHGRRMSLYHEEYEHGVGMAAGKTATYAIPPGASTFRAMVGIDDDADDQAQVRLSAKLDDKEIWCSRPLRAGERQMAFIGVAGGKHLMLQVDGAEGLPGNWGGAKFTIDDPERPVVDPQRKAE